MDSSVLSAIITGAFTAFCTFVGHVVGQRNAATLSKKQIRERQLTNVLAPMDKLLSFSPCDDASDVLIRFGCIIEENYRDTPSAIIEEYKRLRRIRNVTFGQLQTLIVMVSSFYNWTKKALGYSFDSRKIRQEYTPISRRTFLFSVIVNGLAFFIYLIATAFLFLYGARFVQGNAPTVPSLLIESCIVIFTCGTVYSLFSRTHSR